MLTIGEAGKAFSAQRLNTPARYRSNYDRIQRGVFDSATHHPPRPMVPGHTGKVERRDRAQPPNGKAR